VRLVITPTGGLVVVVPRNFDLQGIPAVLEAKRPWIERVWSSIEAGQRPVRGGAGGAALPDRIVLPAVGEEWDVEYQPRPGEDLEANGRRRVAARELPGRRLVVTGAIEEEEGCREALIGWLRRRARDTLIPRLEETAAAHALTFRRVSIRHQRTRWASCSRRGEISLNVALLFLEPDLLDHILLHELCHTVELNHSKRFWELVRDGDSACAVHRRQVREAWKSLPFWLHRERGHRDL
jgi:hypothetical protein